MKYRWLALLEPPLSRIGDSNAAKLGWLVRLRWIALGAQSLSILPALRFDLLERERVPVFLAVVAPLALLNAVTWERLRRGLEISPVEAGRPALRRHPRALGAARDLTGGAWNPIVPILLVHSVLGALLLEGRVSARVLRSLVVCLGLIQTTGGFRRDSPARSCPRTSCFPRSSSWRSSSGS